MADLEVDLFDSDLGLIAETSWPRVAASGNSIEDGRALWVWHQAVVTWLRAQSVGGVFFDVAASMIAVRGESKDVVLVPGDRFGVVAGELFRSV